MKIQKQSELASRLNEAITIKQTTENLTKKDLAYKLNISTYKLNRFQSGQMDPRLDFLKKITRGLGLKLTVL